MTTTCSAPRLLWFGAALAACAPSRPIPASHAAVGPTLVSALPPEPLELPASPSESRAAHYGQWLEISSGDGNGHALPNVQTTTAAVLVSNVFAKAYYCDRFTLEDDATFGVAEVLVVGGERSLYYIIERVKGGGWQYLVHIAGETTPGSPLCADCHEQGRTDPFFRAFRDPACP
jgi:hypothetical protein